MSRILQLQFVLVFLAVVILLLVVLFEPKIEKVPADWSESERDLERMTRTMDRQERTAEIERRITGQTNPDEPATPPITGAEATEPPFTTDGGEVAPTPTATAAPARPVRRATGLGQPPVRQPRETPALQETRY